MPLPDVEAFKRRLSPSVVRRIYDDEDVGEGDDETIQQCLTEAKSVVFATLRPIYPGKLASITENPPDLVSTLMLDIAEARAAKRHPEAVRRDWVPLWEAARLILKDLRDRKISLDVEGDPEPAVNDGVTYTETPDPFVDTACSKAVFQDFGVY